MAGGGRLTGSPAWALCASGALLFPPARRLTTAGRTLQAPLAHLPRGRRLSLRLPAHSVSGFWTPSPLGGAATAHASVLVA